ncbi:MAG: pseudaminic acid synthase [Gammaproteobacteria bacterium]|nr:pseudaminic acid synthase [Gammaproteobacteria bacterium]
MSASPLPPLPFELAGTKIGPGYPPYMIAELSGNHGGDLNRAVAMIDAAVNAGADAIKIQSYTAETITLDHDHPDFRVPDGLWQGRQLYELYQEAHTPWSWHAPLFAHAKKRGIPLFSSPFDPSAVSLLESLHCPAYKIASFELVDTPLIAIVAQTGKPTILSTGMATPAEIDSAVTTFRHHSSAPLALLHCTSSYPAPLAEADLNTIPWLQQQFSAISGLSDHTLGITVAVTAVALGAHIIEKHFTLSREEGAVDAAFSLEPDEFAAMATGCREAWQALGRVRTGPSPREEGSLRFRRSLYAVAPIRKGERFSEDNIRSIRPAFGLPPHYLNQILGQIALRDIERGEPLSLEMFTPQSAATATTTQQG